MIVTSIGSQSIGRGESYPPSDHPTRYLFTKEKGRILDEYQLLYISEGSGSFFSRTGALEGIRVNAGDAFLLFPGEWHNYYPDPDCGWKEYWIGFRGPMADNWDVEGFVKRSAPLFHTGLRDSLSGLFKTGIELANEQKSGYQQMLCGIVCRLLSSVVFLDRNRTLGNMDTLIDKVHALILDNLAAVTPESLARDSGMSYSKFRHAFKAYTGLAPRQYITKMRIAKAKELLTNSDAQIQEIAWQTGYENADYFTTVFKRETGQNASEYRKPAPSGARRED